MLCLSTEPPLWLLPHKDRSTGGVGVVYDRVPKSMHELPREDDADPYNLGLWGSALGLPFAKAPVLAVGVTILWPWPWLIMTVEGGGLGPPAEFVLTWHWPAWSSEPANASTLMVTPSRGLAVIPGGDVPGGFAALVLTGFRIHLRT